MSHVLNKAERRALEKMGFECGVFLMKGQFSSGVGITTLDELVGLGLAEKGRSERYPGAVGWRITADGWRCMYGATYQDIRKPSAKPLLPLRIWRWPPS